MRSGDVEKTVTPTGRIAEQLSVETNRRQGLLVDSNRNPLQNQIVRFTRAGLLAINRVAQRRAIIHVVSPALASAGFRGFRRRGFVSDFLREGGRQEREENKHRPR